MKQKQLISLLFVLAFLITFLSSALPTNAQIRASGKNSQLIPSPAAPRASAMAIAAGDYHTCALTVSGGVKCWGDNYAGDLGDGTMMERLTPIDVIGLTSGVTAIAAGGAYTCALTASGGIKCWGFNQHGQLGDGTTTDRWTPVNVSGLTSGVVAIATGWMHTCALTASGGVKCWGWNNWGQLGDGTITDRLTPVDVGGLTSGVIAIAAGGGYTCGLTVSGGVKCWGFNYEGELGDGTTTERLTPVNVSGLTNGVGAISAGGWHTCALTASGGIKCWGFNYYGELGDGTTTTHLTPVDVTGLTSGVNAIAAGADHSCALIASGGVKCWGWNNWGQLGDGTTTQRLTPVDVVCFFGSIDLCFRPNPNGYQFANYGGNYPLPPSNGDFTTDDMRRMFGDSAVCQVVLGSVCLPKASAVKWNLQINFYMNNGHCDGFTTTSLRFSKGLDTTSSFQNGANTTHDLLLANARRNIAYYFALQGASPVLAARLQALQKSPSDVLTQLQTAMSGGATDPTTLIFYNSAFTSGHSVTPYAIQDQGGGIYWVSVYDSNYPDASTRHVVIDTGANTWSYDLGFATWSGNASSHSIGVIPLSTYAQSPQCSWCTGTGNRPLSPLSATTSQQVWLSGQGHLLITNSSGQRIGYVGNQFVSEIPTALGSLIPGGLGIQQEPIYNLPITDTYTVLLNGQTVTQTQTVGVAQIGPGYAVSADNVNVQPTTNDILTIASDGTQISYKSSDTKPITLTLGLDGTSQSNQFQIKGATIGAGQIVTTTADTIQGKLVINNKQGSSGAYEFDFTRVGTGGSQTFIHTGINIAATDTQYLNYSTWNGTGPITLQIDQGSVGVISQTIVLNNQAPRIFLPIIIR